MSRPVYLKTQIKSPTLVAKVCKRLGLPEPDRIDLTRVRPGERAMAVKLPGWRDKIAINTTTGIVCYESISDKECPLNELDVLLQVCICEYAKVVAITQAIDKKQDRLRVVESAMPNGDIVVTVYKPD